MILLSLSLRSNGKMSMPVAKMMNSKHSFSLTPTHPQPNSEQASHEVSEFESGASPSPSSDVTTY